MNKFIAQASKAKYMVVGLNLENFLFKLTSAGLGFSKVKRKGSRLFFITNCVNEEFIFSTAEEMGLEISVIKTIGFIQVIKRLPYSLGAMFGIGFWAILLFVMSGYIYKVDYITEENHVCTNGKNCIYETNNFEDIKAYLSSCGVQEGETNKINLTNLSKNVMANFPLVESCSINKNGSVITITLKEATGKTLTDYTKIVAEKNCIITSITTHSGRALVKAGDIVVAGQTLVESDGNVKPKASITAKVWTTGLAVYNQNRQMLKRTGKSYTHVGYNLLGIKLETKINCPFGYYETVTTNNYLAPNLFLPIEKITTIYWEVELIEEYIPFEDVKAEIYAKAKADAISKIKGSPEECTYSIVTEGDVVRVDCYLLSIENVGIYS